MKIAFLFFRGLLQRHRLCFALIALSSFFSFLCQAGLGSSLDLISVNREMFNETTGMGDIVLRTEEVPRGEILGMLAQIDGVEEADEGYIWSVRCRSLDGTIRTARFFSYAEESIVTPLITGKGDFALSYGYETSFPLQNVRTLVLPDGNKITVDATVGMPAYTSVYVNEYIMCTGGEIIDVYSDIEKIWALSGSKDVNFAVIKLDRNADSSIILDRILANNNILVKNAYTTLAEPSYQTSTNLAEIVLSICRLFPWIFLVVGLFFICIFLSGLFNQTNAVTILHINGASLPDIFTGVFLFCLSGVLLGWVLSIPFALLLAKHISVLTLTNMGVPYDISIFPFNRLLIGFAASIVVSFISSLTGAAFMFRRRFFENMYRKRQRKTNVATDVVMMALCTAVSFSLVACTLIYKDSLNCVKEDLFSERYTFDAQVIYEDFVPLTHIKKLRSSPAVLRVEPMLTGRATLHFDGKSCETVGVALSEDSTLMSFYDSDGDSLKAVRNQIIVSSKTARQLGVTKGDVIELEISYSGKWLYVTCMIAGVSQQHSSFTELVSIDTVEEYLDSSGIMNSASITVNTGDITAFLKHAEKLEDVYSIQLKENALNRFNMRFSGTEKLINIIIAIGIFLGFSICMLIGYSSWKRNLNINVVYIIQGGSAFLRAIKNGLIQLFGVMLGIIVGYPTSISAASQILVFLSNDKIYYPTIFRDRMWFYVIGLSFLYVIIVVLFFGIVTSFRARKNPEWD